MSDNDWRQGMRLWIAVLACAACAPADKEVGSACKDGVCTGALTTRGPVCLATGMEMEITPTDAPNTVCLPRRFHKGEDGKLICEVSWTVAGSRRGGGDGPARCPDLPFVMPGPDDTCTVEQIALPSQATSSGEGWYYDESDIGTCEGPAALHFTERAIIPERSTGIFSCRTLLGLSAMGDLEPVDADQCTLPDDNAKHANTIGDPCQPPVPEGGFQESESYVETGASECGTGVCIVYHVNGDPSASCEAGDAGSRCAPPQEVADRVYCSCRCDAAPGEPDACDCPRDYSCVPPFADRPAGPAHLDGRYCVKMFTGHALSPDVAPN